MLLLISLFTLTLTGCEKDEITRPERTGLSEYEFSDSQKVFDDSGTYWIDVTVKSDEKKLVDQYFENELVLVLEREILDDGLDDTLNDETQFSENTEMVDAKSDRLIEFGERNIPEGYWYGVDVIPPKDDAVSFEKVSL